MYLISAHSAWRVQYLKLPLIISQDANTQFQCLLMWSTALCLDIDNDIIKWKAGSLLLHYRK